MSKETNPPIVSQNQPMETMYHDGLSWRVLAAAVGVAAALLAISTYSGSETAPDSKPKAPQTAPEAPHAAALFVVGLTGVNGAGPVQRF